MREYGKLIVAGVVVLVAVIFLWSSVAVVPAGHVGVVTAFGRVESDTLGEGLHFVPFWKDVTELSVRTQERKEVADVPTREGLTVNLDVSLLFALQRESASEVYQKIGEEYVNVVVTPQLRSALRGVTVNFKSEDLYTANRIEVEQKLETTLREILRERGIHCERVLLRGVQLPPAVKNAIDSKVAAEQKNQEMEIQLQQARKEAEKKKIEAEATAEAQQIITGTLNENYIRYLWVKALETAAQSRTAMIYVPTGANGLPMEMPLKTGPTAGER